MTRLSIKVGVFLAAVLSASSARAFNVLQCQGDIDVRLKEGSAKKESAKKDKLVQSFTIKREDALELDLSIGGNQMGHLFPWDHVVWEPDVGLMKNFKNVKFKTDDSKLISISAVDLKTKKSHAIECEFQFD